MTSVASYDDATTAGNFTLIHSTVMLGNWIEDFNSSFGRLTPIARRQNFWSSDIILDGRYPAQVWDHTFKLYTEGGSLGELYDKFLDIYDQIHSDPATLTINDGDTATELFQFGACYLEDASLETPEAFLKYNAGLITVTFVGNTRPTVP